MCLFFGRGGAGASHIIDEKEVLALATDHVSLKMLRGLCVLLMAYANSHKALNGPRVSAHMKAA